MSTHKIIIFLIMLAVEFFAWDLIGQGLAKIFVDPNETYTYSDQCNCDDVIAHYIKSADIRDNQKTEYLKKYVNLNIFDREFFNKNVNNAEIEISYEEAIVIIGHRITVICIAISFTYILIMLIILNQGGCNGYFVTPIGWIVVGLVAFIYYITAGRKERSENKRKRFHDKVSSLADKFKSYNRMA